MFSIPDVFFVEDIEAARQFVADRRGQLSPEEGEVLANRFGDELLAWWAERYPERRDAQEPRA